MNTTVFLNSRLEKIQEQIVAYEDAIDALLNNGAQSYSLDTGQSRQQVTKLNLPSLEMRLDSLYNRYTTLHARLNRTGSHSGVPAW